MHSPANFDFFCDYKMAPGVSEGHLRAKQESKTVHRVRFSRSRGLKLVKTVHAGLYQNKMP